MIRAALFTISVTLLLGACATGKEAQVRSALTRAGLPSTTAQCMATPLARDLTAGQLQSLGRLARRANDNRANMSEGEILDMLRHDLDPQVVGVVLRAGLGCMMRG